MQLPSLQRVRPWRQLLLGVLAALTLAAPASSAAATPPGMPPGGKVLLGVGGRAATVASYDQLTGAQHKIQLYTYFWRADRDWNEALDPTFEATSAGSFRAMIHLTPIDGNGRKALTPRDAATGRGDPYLIRLAFVLNQSNQIVYVRPPGEMNGHWNPWCAFNEDGSRRSSAHAALQYRRAFQRMTLIMRGGSVARINAALAMRGMPALRTKVATIPSSGRIAMVFNPQGRGKPDVRGNQPQDYYPGPRAVDYVANDMYAQDGNAAWDANGQLYARYQRAHPYMMAEYAPWGYDDPGFMRRMFAWVSSHPRTVALIYFHGASTSPFRLDRGKPGSLAVYRDRSRNARFSCPNLSPIRRAC